MKTCISCSRTFEKSSDVQVGSHCPSKHCAGIIKDIDENICYAIIELNKKYFETEECCSGHIINQMNPYVIFNEIVCLDSFPSLPKGFKSAITDEGKLKIYSEVASDDTLERQKALTELSVNLLEWSRRLSAGKVLFALFYVDCDSETEKSITQVIKKAKDKLNLNFASAPGEIFVDKGNEYTIIDYGIRIDPNARKTFTDKIESFANHHNIEFGIMDCDV